MEYDQTLAEDMLPDPEPFRPADDDAAEPCESENETQTASTSSVQKDSKRTTTTTAISQSTVQQVPFEEDDNGIDKKQNGRTAEQQNEITLQKTCS